MRTLDRFGPQHRTACYLYPLDIDWFADQAGGGLFKVSVGVDLHLHGARAGLQIQHGAAHALQGPAAFQRGTRGGRRAACHAAGLHRAAGRRDAAFDFNIGVGTAGDLFAVLVDAGCSGADRAVAQRKRHVAGVPVDATQHPLELNRWRCVARLHLS